MSVENVSLASPEAKIKKGRIEWIDTAKAISILCVIFCHAIGQGDVVEYMYSFHLPVFFILNGMTLRIKQGETLGSFLERKLKSYMIPIVFLGVLSILFDLALHDVNQVELSWNFVVKSLVGLYQQVRMYPLWFVAALFVSDIIVYAIIRMGFGRLWVSAILAAAQLAIAICFNRFHSQWLMWNLDTAMFGSVFVFIGYCFYQPFNSRIREFLLGKRWISLFAAAVLLSSGMSLAKYTFANFNGAYLEMWRGSYSPYYLIIPIAFINSFGVIFLSRAVTCVPFAWLGQSTIVLLAFHQRFAFPIFTNYIAKGWIQGFLAAPLELNDIRRLYYALALTSFTLAILLPIYVFIIYTPLSVCLNRPMLECYYGLFSKKKKQRDSVSQ